MKKSIPIGSKPAPNTQTWIQRGNRETHTEAKATLYTARLTIDVTPALRGRIKIVAFERGMTVAELLRLLLEREFSEADSTPCKR